MKELLKPKIAVVLAVFNGENWLPEQIHSILSQKYVEVVIYISIDPSSDNSVKICTMFSNCNQNICILPNLGKFGGAAKNFFRLIRDVDFSNFNYLALSDQDDIWFENKLISAVKKLQETNSDGYSSNITAFWPSGKKKLINKSQPQRQWDYLFEAAGPGCTYVMTTNLALDIKKTISTNWIDVNKLGLHDWFCYAFARANNYKWFIDQTTTMLYRQHTANQVGVNSGRKAFFYRVIKITNGWGINQSILIARLVGKINDPFVKSWRDLNLLGFLRLAFNANKCRRKPSERILFFFSCLWMAVFTRNNGKW